MKKKPIKILKNRLVRFWFWFYKLETEKTEPNPNKKNRKKPEPKPSQTEKIEPNRFCPKKPNRTETGLFEPVRFGFSFF